MRGRRQRWPGGRDAHEVPGRDAGPLSPFEALARLQARLRAPEWEAALAAARRDGPDPDDGERADE